MIRSSRVYRVFYDQLFFPVFLRVYFIWIRKILGESFREKRYLEIMLSAKILTGLVGE